MLMQIEVHRAGKVSFTSPTFPYGNSTHFANHEALPQFCRMQKEIALSFRHFNIIWPNIPRNSSIVMKLLTDLLHGIGSLSGKRISVVFFSFFHKETQKFKMC